MGKNRKFVPHLWVPQGSPKDFQGVHHLTSNITDNCVRSMRQKSHKWSPWTHFWKPLRSLAPPTWSVWGDCTLENVSGSQSFHRAADQSASALAQGPECQAFPPVSGYMPIFLRGAPQGVPEKACGGPRSCVRVVLPFHLPVPVLLFFLTVFIYKYVYTYMGVSGKPC